MDIDETRQYGESLEYASQDNLSELFIQLEVLYLQSLYN